AFRRPARGIRQWGAEPHHRRDHRRRARVVVVAGGSPHGVRVAAGCQGLGLLARSGQGAAVDGTGGWLATRVRAGGSAQFDNRRLGLLLPGGEPLTPHRALRLCRLACRLCVMCSSLVRASLMSGVIWPNNGGVLSGE